MFMSNGILYIVYCNVSKVQDEGKFTVQLSYVGDVLVCECE